jgi:hypothetical protein
VNAWNGCPTGETDLYVARFSRNKKANFSKCNVATARKCQRKIGAIIDKINLWAKPHAPTKKEAMHLVELKRTFWDSWYCGRKLCAIERQRCISSQHWRTQKAPTPVVVMMTTMMRMMKVAQHVMVEVAQVAMVVVAGQKKHFADQSALWIDGHWRWACTRVFAFVCVCGYMGTLSISKKQHQHTPPTAMHTHVACCFFCDVQFAIRKGMFMMWRFCNLLQFKLKQAPTCTQANVAASNGHQSQRPSSLTIRDCADHRKVPLWLFSDLPWTRIALSLQTAPRTSNNQHAHLEIQNQPRASIHASTANLSLRVCCDLKLIFQEIQETPPQR